MIDDYVVSYEIWKKLYNINLRTYFTNGTLVKFNKNN